VKGYTRSTICDLQRQTYQLIPNELYEILQFSNKEMVSAIKYRYNSEKDSEIDDYFQFLVQNEFGFMTLKPEDFDEIKLNFEDPCQISNAIIDVGCDSRFDFRNIFLQLDDLGCTAVEIRSYEKIPFELCLEIVEGCEATCIRALNFTVHYSSDEFKESFIKLCETNARVLLVILHSSPSSKSVSINSDQNVHAIEQVISSEACCGVIHPGYFNLHLKHFTESIEHNTCLNKKISIDRFGNIKNCPSFQTSFGNVNEIKLRDVLDKKEYSDVWSISKRKIEVCMDCEFKAICTDCRAYRKDDGIYSKPSKCNYNPYTAKWS